MKKSIFFLLIVVVFLVSCNKENGNSNNSDTDVVKTDSFVIDIDSYDEDTDFSDAADFDIEKNNDTENIADDSDTNDHTDDGNTDDDIDTGNTESDKDTGNTGDDTDVISICGNKVLENNEVCEQDETKPCEEVGENWSPLNEAMCNSTCSGWDTYSCIDIDTPTCYQTYECVRECENSICEEECVEKANPGAKSKYDTMINCYETNCPDREEDCINEKCKYQTDACKTHMTCGNGMIDDYEICESPETIDCGEIKDGSGEAIYEAGTANAFCNPNCTEWDDMMCYKFCSCSAIKNCVATNCGDYATADSNCIKECENLGSYEGKNQHKAWRTFIENCSDSDGFAGFESELCVSESDKNNPCGSTANSKCEY